MNLLSLAHAKALAKKCNLDQVVILGWNRLTNITNVTTYGKTKVDCAIAAESGNNLKNALGWPDELCNEIPRRVDNAWCDDQLKNVYIRSAVVTGPGHLTITAESGQSIVMTRMQLLACLFKLRKSKAGPKP